MPRPLCGYQKDSDIFQGVGSTMGGPSSCSVHRHKSPKPHRPPRPPPPASLQLLDSPLFDTMSNQVAITHDVLLDKEVEKKIEDADIGNVGEGGQVLETKFASASQLVPIVSWVQVGVANHG